jgi:hypothetical protein
MEVPPDHPDAGATMSFAVGAAAPAQARRFVARQLREWKLERCEDTAVLLVSELVTNSLLHARTDMVVAIRKGAGEVILEVSDGSPTPPTVRRFSAHAGTVAACTWSSRWGSSGASVRTTAPERRCGWSCRRIPRNEAQRSTSTRYKRCDDAIN